jgi:hypothetical protein
MLWLVAGYWVLAALTIGAAALLTLQTWEHCRFAHGRVWDFNFNPTECKGHIALIVPCKGSDSDLEGNLRPLFEQDHEDYELVFSVESVDDPAYVTIRRLMAQYASRTARLVVAGLTTGSGQKVHNLLAATRQLGPHVDIFVFVDADVRPPRDWLRVLTQRLNHFVAATGYRWWVPKRATLANCIVASIDSSIVPIMFPSFHHKVWGGSWAIRREVFESSGLSEAWAGTLSDDLVAANVLAALGESVSLEPACILPTPIDMTMRSMFAFVRRQFMIGRYYSLGLWSVALAGNCLIQAAFWGSFVAAIAGIATGASWTWQPVSVFGLLYTLHLIRAWLRQQATRFYLPQVQDELAAARRFDIWLGPLAGLACCAGLIASAFGRKIVWKNIAYEMRFGGQVRGISYTSGGPATLDGRTPIPSQRQRSA